MDIKGKNVVVALGENPIARRVEATLSALGAELVEGHNAAGDVLVVSAPGPAALDVMYDVTLSTLGLLNAVDAEGLPLVPPLMACRGMETLQGRVLHINPDGRAAVRAGDAVSLVPLGELLPPPPTREDRGAEMRAQWEALRDAQRSSHAAWVLLAEEVNYARP